MDATAADGNPARAWSGGVPSATCALLTQDSNQAARPPCWDDESAGAAGPAAIFAVGSPWHASDALTHVHRMANGRVADEILYWHDEARLESGQVAPMSRGPRRVIRLSALALLEVLAVAGVIWEATNSDATRRERSSGISFPRGLATRGR